MTYTPNFNDSRVQARARKALNFVELYIKSKDVSWISYKELFKHFGNTNRQPGQWFLQTLLDVRDSYYNSLTGQCKKYSKNTQGVKLVKDLLNDPDFVPQIAPELAEQLQSGEFQYQEKSNRLFNPLQYIPKQLRNSILNNHGYRFHYDITAAAPTLILQRAQKLDPNLKLPTLESYVENRSEFRKQIASECEISENSVKRVINGILQGGIISRWTNNKIFADLNYDRDAVIKLNHSELIISLKSDISQLWKSLRDEFSVRYITNKSGKSVRKRITPKEKSGYYRELEKQVGDVIRKMLRKQQINSLWIHDGWCCDKVIDPALIVSEVRRQTGFVIELDWTIYED